MALKPKKLSSSAAVRLSEETTARVRRLAAKGNFTLQSVGEEAMRRGLDDLEREEKGSSPGSKPSTPPATK